jgi:hypothetical protein
VFTFIYNVGKRDPVFMKGKKIETVCGYSCSDCTHHESECSGCGKTKGAPFWTAYVDVKHCPVYDCCVTGKKLAHCGKCPELICERFTRFKDPNRTEEESAACLGAMEKELRSRP